MFDNHQYIKFILELIALILREIYKLLFYFTKIKSNRITFFAYWGSNYVCNPKFITEYLINHGYKNKLELIWLCNNEEDCELLKKKGIKTIKGLYSLSFLKALLTSAVIIDNGMPLHFFTRREKQVYIGTWHGGGCYKKSGINIGYINPLTKSALKYSANQMSHFISSSDYFSKNIIQKSYSYFGKILEIGMPRNDALFQNNHYKEKICKFYNIDFSTNIVLYAPTFRDNSKKITSPKDINLDIDKLIKSLKNKYGGNWVVLIRSHRRQFVEKMEDTIDASKYPEMQELLCSANILISDYSSCIWDYSLTLKPCFLFCPDLEEYKSNRDFYVDIHKWHFPIAESNEELQKIIKNFDEEVFKNNMILHQKELGSFEKGNSCRKVCDLILNHIKGM